MKLTQMVMMASFAVVLTGGSTYAAAQHCDKIGVNTQNVVLAAQREITNVYDYAQLKEAIERAEPFIRVPEHVVIEVPNYANAINLKANQTLFSVRGYSEAPGKLVIKPNKTSEQDKYPVITMQSHSRITGLVIEGPVKKSHSVKKTIGIQTVPNSLGVSVDNNELFGWPWAALSVKQSIQTAFNHNYVHHNIKRELGYGIVVQGGNATALVECNVFDKNRHGIAGEGKPGEGYLARYNLVMQGGKRGAYHQFDMHADSQGNGGSFVHVTNNWFNFGAYGTSNRSSLHVRGVPIEGASKVSGNIFKTPFQITSRNQAVTGVAGAIPEIAELEANNQFSQPFTFYQQNPNDCWMEVAGERTPVFCKGVGF